MCALYYPTVASLNDPTVELLYLARIATATYFIAAYSNFFAKTPLLILYIKLFGAKSWVRWASYTTLALGFMGFTATSIAGVMYHPEGKVLDQEYFAGFLHRSYVVAVTNATFNLAMDIVAFIIPIPVIASLHLPTRRKIGLALMFFSGIVAIATGAVSLHYRRSSSAQSIIDLTIVCLCTIADSGIAIMLGCVPALRGLWLKHGSQLSFVSKLQSKLSSSRTTATKSTKSTQSQSQLYAENTHRKSPSHSYIELEEGSITRDKFAGPR
jgi:hypothetical protein